MRRVDDILQLSFLRLRRHKVSGFSPRVCPGIHGVGNSVVFKAFAGIQSFSASIHTVFKTYNEIKRTRGLSGHADMFIIFSNLLCIRWFLAFNSLFIMTARERGGGISPSPITTDYQTSSKHSPIKVQCFIRLWRIFP